jgi:endonuclease G
VSWQIRKSDLGPIERSNEFHPEPDLPASWRITPGDYTGSGYDRGHVCPSGDRTAAKRSNEATFSMANMLPQAAALNRGPWGDLENYCRDLVRKGNDLYVVAGGYGTKGVVAKGRVAVPSHFFKVIVVCPAGATVPGAVTAEMPLIAVDFPNEENVELDWKRYVTTVEAIEQATGLILFNSLAPSVREVFRAKPSALSIRSEPNGTPKALQGGVVVGNRKSKIYHVPGCPGYEQVAKENRVKFATPEEAERAGYRRAGNCP